MLRTHRAVALGLLVVSCSLSRAGADRNPSGAPASPSAPVASATPSFPETAVFFDGATATIPLPGRRPGHLFVAVESKRTPRGVTTTLHVTRNADCHVESGDGGLFVCTTVYDRRVPLPQGAFTFDGALDTATLDSTVEGKRLALTWAGYGEIRRKVNENGALLIEARDAKATATWGRVRHVDRDGTDEPSSLYRRVTAAAP